MKRYHVVFQDPCGNPCASRFEYAESEEVLHKKYGSNIYLIQEA